MRDESSIAVWLLFTSMHFSLLKYISSLRMGPAGVSCMFHAWTCTDIWQPLLVCSVFMSKFFSLVSVAWIENFTNIEAQLHTEVMRFTLEIFLLWLLKHPGIRPKKGYIALEMEHLCFWRAIHEIPTVLGGEMRYSTDHFKRLANLP